jgi:hypothetical protein
MVESTGGFILHLAMTPAFRPEPPPQNDLERLMRKAADDPALHGRMWHMLSESELYMFIPDHPEMPGHLR